ncbi:hypothetical protein GUJ93_ZPchr0010g9290 [Zizania palustris]|uniref:Uncharacterized protein n=1 Tax=Zizania palustris TaxID=103762 RepID=A0A8J5WBG9_ZIZPA|nr:hypothetical protein GUJ93_ZPchr0010g9290 [Zizania palustris]
MVSVGEATHFLSGVKALIRAASPAPPPLRSRSCHQGSRHCQGVSRPPPPRYSPGRAAQETRQGVSSRAAQGTRRRLATGPDAIPHPATLRPRRRQCHNRSLESTTMTIADKVSVLFIRTAAAFRYATKRLVTDVVTLRKRFVGDRRQCKNETDSTLQELTSLRSNHRNTEAMTLQWWRLGTSYFHCETNKGAKNLNCLGTLKREESAHFPGQRMVGEGNSNLLKLEEILLWIVNLDSSGN